MKTGLFDVLKGSFVDGTSIGNADGYEARHLSVIGNLTHLFNSRRGALKHLPEYGLPDLGSMYRKMPESIDELCRVVQDTVEKFEPRLRRVRVKPHVTDSNEARLALVVTAELDGERVRFRTTFSPADPVEVGEYIRNN